MNIFMNIGDTWPKDIYIIDPIRQELLNPEVLQAVKWM